MILTLSLDIQEYDVRSSRQYSTATLNLLLRHIIEHNAGGSIFQTIFVDNAR